MLAVHEYAAPGRRPLAAAALAAVFATATLTITVHLLELSVARHGQLGADPDLTWVFAFTWPSLLYGVEIVAWNCFFGTALVCASGVFSGHGREPGQKPGRERTIRIGLSAAGVLTLAGLIGPVVGSPDWRVIGVLGYGVVLPPVCLLIGSVLIRAADDRDHSSRGLRRLGSTGRPAQRGVHPPLPDALDERSTQARPR